MASSMTTSAHVFAIPGCPYFAFTKQLLNARRIPFTHSFPTTRQRQILQAKYHYAKLPIIILALNDGTRKVLLGSDRLDEFFLSSQNTNELSLSIARTSRGKGRRGPAT